ncbi:hypothetical protein [Caldimonas tepidiphila]|uniref:hypothetical protein n=1 Tax=Caldimonas tepidiphila TaxID=2315841 RepID=UPI0013009717|nr:hypothetical protein [Caldimonas tepidiphila]
MAEKMLRFLFLLVPMGWGAWASYEKAGWSEEILLGALAGVLVLGLVSLLLLGLLGIIVRCLGFFHRH